MSRLRRRSGDRPRDGRSCGSHCFFRRDPPPERRPRQRRHRRENAQRDRRRDRSWARDPVHGPRGEGGGGPLRPRGLPRASRSARAGRCRGLGHARPLGRRARPADAVARNLAAGPGGRSLSPGGQRRPRAGRGGRHLDGPGRGLPRSRLRVVRGTLGHAARARGPGARACGRGSLGARDPRGRAAGAGGRGARPGGGGAGPGGRIRGAASRRRHPFWLGLGWGRMGLGWGRRPAGCPVGARHAAFGGAA